MHRKFKFHIWLLLKYCYSVMFTKIKEKNLELFIMNNENYENFRIFTCAFLYRTQNKGQTIISKQKKTYVFKSVLFLIVKKFRFTLFIASVFAPIWKAELLLMFKLQVLINHYKLFSFQFDKTVSNSKIFNTWMLNKTTYTIILWYT